MSRPRPGSPSLLEHFAALRDPREGWRVLYRLREILLVVLCATLCGMDDFVEIKLWGEARLKFLRRFLPFERGIPSQDTLNDVMNGIDAKLFKLCFAEWVDALRDGEPDIIAVDGKTPRRCHNKARGRGPFHLVSAWAARQRLVLGQEATDAKSNEITAIPLLLERLELAGALVTIDAMGTQSAIADLIVRRGGDDLLALKANRPATRDDVARVFADPPPDLVHSTHTTMELCWNLGDGADQAARCAGTSATSVQSLNVTPAATFGNSFSPFSLRRVLAAAMTSLKTISLAVVGDRAPLVRTVRCRTVAKADPIGFVVRR